MLRNDVGFIIIGGYAVIYHGYIRTTGDMDIWLKPDNSNKQKFITVLENIGISKESIKIVNDLDFANTVAFHFGDPPGKMDFISNIRGLNFEEAYQQVEYLHLEEYEIPVLCLNDLILSKMMTDRMKDKADIEELQKIHRLKKSND